MNENIRTIHPRKRYKILQKYNFTCCACGKTSDEIPLEIDHIIPVSKGGTNDEKNLQVLCYECNQRKFNQDDDTFKSDSEEYIKDYLERKKISKLSSTAKLNILKSILNKYKEYSWNEVSILLDFEASVRALNIDARKTKALFEQIILSRIKTFRDDKEVIKLKSEIINSIYSHLSKEKGITIQDLADSLGVSLRTVKNWLERSRKDAN